MGKTPRYKVTVLVVEEGLEDLGLCAITSWSELSDLPEHAHQVLTSCLETVKLHEASNG